MVTFFEIVKRALNGPYSTEWDFDLELLVPKLREVVRKYEIHFDSEDPIPVDDRMADNVFAAALELCAETGCYCTDTNRIIQFTREEIAEALQEAPRKPQFGEGRDRKAMVGREPECDIPPWCYVGAGGATCTDQDVYVRLVEGYGNSFSSLHTYFFKFHRI